MTLEKDGPDLFLPPTLRGARNICGTGTGRGDGFGAYILFVVQMSGCRAFSPNDDTDPDFGAALRLAAQNGVGVLTVDCLVTEDGMVPGSPVPVIL